MSIPAHDPSWKSAASAMKGSTSFVESFHKWADEAIWEKVEQGLKGGSLEVSDPEGSDALSATAFVADLFKDPEDYVHLTITVHPMGHIEATVMRPDGPPATANSPLAAQRFKFGSDAAFFSRFFLQALAALAPEKP